jgi:hypothetical protein
MYILRTEVTCNARATRQWHTQEFFSGGVTPEIFLGGGEGVQQIQLRTEGRENGDLGVVAP